MRFLRRYYSQILFLLIGALTGFFISRLPIHFEDKISWIALANFLLTILLAVYLEFVVRPSFTNTRNEKDILIDQLKEVRKEIALLHEQYTLERGHNPLPAQIKSEILIKFRSVSNSIDLLRHTDEHCSTTIDTKLSQSLFASYLTYKKALTGKNFNSSHFYFDRLFWKDQERAYNTVIKLIMHSILDVNKA
jgi:hypothetical protein